MICVCESIYVREARDPNTVILRNAVTLKKVARQIPPWQNDAAILTGANPNR